MIRSLLALVSPKGPRVGCHTCRRNSRGRSASPTVRHQQSQERRGQLAVSGEASSTGRLRGSAESTQQDPGSEYAIGTDSPSRSRQHRGTVSSNVAGMGLVKGSGSNIVEVDMLEQSATAIDPSTRLQLELDSQPHLQLPTHAELLSSDMVFDRSAVQDKARSSSAFSASLLRAGLEGVDGTTVDHLVSGLQLGWRDDGDRHVSQGQLTSPRTGTSLPPAVRTNTAAEEAELLGTETDVEDEVTKTDL